ncbi:MAG: HlyD family efflux transporter periplasmic adaptor subunit [Candidatus Hydrogenedentes bacterium]|nr:HlyD family efflux transporter periplasmic adaptor subunit [Candidatus Hydrogenedentota bacterium]
MRRVAVLPIAVGVSALALGVATLLALILFRKPPAEAAPTDKEKPIQVEVVAVQPKDVPVTITGWGPAKALNVVKIGPEVSGRVTEIHPNLLVGGIVPKGEPLFVIDRDPYIARENEARAHVAQLDGTLARLKTEWENEKQRMAAMERSRDLAKAQYERLKELMADDVGTATNVDEAERNFVNAKDQTDQLDHELALYPLRIRETESMLESSKAQLAMAELDLKKTRVDAPFDARVTQVDLKKDQVIQAGAPVATIADDSLLEISVPLNSADARRWLKFNEAKSVPGAAWFSALDKVECQVRWTEQPDEHCWKGRLERVESFDQESRQLTIVVRVSGADAKAGPEGLPLVEGMYCIVEIPGKTMQKVYEVPAHALSSFENTVYAAVDNRLKTVPVEVTKSDKNTVYISGGLEPGQMVITTRLVNPLENSLVTITGADAQAAPESDTVAKS